MRFYAFVAGPLLWISFAVFVIGSLVRIGMFLRVSSQKDKPVYQYFNLSYVLKTYGRWLLPVNPGVFKTPSFMLLAYAFHFCLILVPILLRGHIIVWEESRFGWSWPALPPLIADVMTLAVIAIAALFLLRRLVSQDVRLLSTFSDYALLVVAALPFLTGYCLVHGTWNTFISPFGMQTIHLLSGELMLILIPLTKLSHFVLFFFSRGATAVEFGRRGYSV
jgi:nitrate reductase gamma subunit